MTIYLSLAHIIFIIVRTYIIIGLIAWFLCKKKKHMLALMGGVVAFWLFNGIVMLGIINTEIDYANVTTSDLVGINEHNMYVCEDGTVYTLSAWNTNIIDGYSVKINDDDFQSCKVTALCIYHHYIGPFDIIYSSTDTCLYMDETMYESIYKTTDDN